MPLISVTVILGKPDAHFFGDAVPAGLASTYVPVKVTIAPMRVRVGEPVPSASLGAKSRLARFGWLSEVIGANKILHTIATNLPAPAVVPAHALLLIPESHRDLLTRPVHGVLATMMPVGDPGSVDPSPTARSGLGCPKGMRGIVRFISFVTKL